LEAADPVLLQSIWYARCSALEKFNHRVAGATMTYRSSA